MDLDALLATLSAMEAKLYDQMELILVNHQPLDELGRELQQLLQEGRARAERREAYIREHGASDELYVADAVAFKDAEQRLEQLGAEFTRRTQEKAREMVITLQVLNEELAKDPENERLRELRNILQLGVNGEDLGRLTEELQQRFQPKDQGE